MSDSAAPASPRRDAICSLALVSTFIISSVIVGVSGDFPLCDDWSFAVTARRLAKDHVWLPHDWTSMPLLTHSLWAAIPCALTTCSFEVLRGTTLVASLLLTLISYALFRHLRHSYEVALVGATAICWNPITYVLSYTFMTDVPFELLLVVSSFASLLFLRYRNGFYLGLCVLLLTATVLCRQLGLCVGIALGLVFWLTSRERLIPTLVKGFLPLAASFGALLAFEKWMSARDILPYAYRVHVDIFMQVWSSSGALLSRVSDNALTCILYIGLFTLPLGLIATPARIWRNPLRDPAALIASTLTASVIGALILKGSLMPTGYNIIHRKGLGPTLLRDIHILGLDNLQDLPPFLWILVTVAAIVGTWIFAYHSVSLAACASRARRSNLGPSTAAGLFAVTAMAIYLVPLLVAISFDRYIAAITPLCCLVLLSAPSREPSWVARSAAGVICAGLMVTSTLATHDYLSWSRARWSAIWYAEATLGVTAERLDGGFEYNGVRSYVAAPITVRETSWWWVQDDTYQIAFGPVPGTEVVERFRFSTYIRSGTNYIYLLRRLGRSS